MSLDEIWKDMKNKLLSDIEIEHQQSTLPDSHFDKQISDGLARLQQAYEELRYGEIVEDAVREALR